MRKLAAILICKLVKLIGGFVGKGTSLPGKYALKICPNILGKIKMPDKIIAVTGSNGKTSTVEMIAHVLTKSGKNVAYNAEGSNQIEGVTTMILDKCTLSGKMRCDVLLIESDERYAKYTFKWFKPDYYIITNLYRDQLTRNGHPQWVFDAINDSIDENTLLVLNADDPATALFGYNRDNVLWFGLDGCKQDSASFNGAYNDGKYCPVCSHELEYEYYHYNHIGKYKCSHCDFERHNTDFTVTDVDLDEGKLTINSKFNIKLAFKSIYNVYNILAAYTASALCSVDEKSIALHLSDYILKNGRFIRFRTGRHKGIFLVSKHENSVSYDMSFRYIADCEEDCSVMLIVDAVSRKYFTSDTSWLWDINFELLNCEHVNKIYLCGKYCHDLALRLSFTGVDLGKILIFEEVEEACRELRVNGCEKVFAVTCFSDKDKFISNVNIVNE